VTNDILININITWVAYGVYVCRKRIKRGRSEELLEDTEANGNVVMEDAVKEDIAKETGNF